MPSDERIINYMKERNDHAKTVASAIAVQLFALAVYFCLYALIFSGMFYSLSENTGKLIMICVSIVIAIGLCVVNVLTVIRSKKVYIIKPDSIAIRDGEEVVRLAYITARPVLIFKITYSLVMPFAGGIVYIMLLIAMEDKALADLYGRIVCSLATAVAVIIAYPCFDRISCYRALLGETHEMFTDIRPDRAFMFIVSIALPLSICLWYILRFYGNSQDIAWIVFPLTALFGLAISFLINWVRKTS